MSKLNLLDRFVSWTDPEKGAKRAQAREAIDAIQSLGQKKDAAALGWGVGFGRDMAEPYKGASRVANALRRFYPGLKSSSRYTEGGGNAGTYNRPRETVAARARALTRNEPLAGGHAKNSVQAIIGSGLRLQSHPDADALNITAQKAEKLSKIIEREWSLFFETAEFDISRRFTGHEIAAQATFGALVDGDCFFMFPMLEDGKERPFRPYKTTVQVIAGDKCSNPNYEIDTLNKTVAGIEMDEQMTPSAYWFSNRSLHDYDIAGRTWKKYDAFDGKNRKSVFHLLFADTNDQVRGMSIFAPVIEKFFTLGKYSEAELMAAVVSAYFTVFITSDTGAGLPPVKWGDDDERSGNADSNEYRMGPAAVLTMPTGTDIKTANPGRPNANYDPFVVAIVKEIAVGLQMPVEVMMMHFSSNYSASRAAIIQAGQYFMAKRKSVAAQYYAAAFEKFMDEAVASGRIKAKGYFDDPIARRAYLAADWIGPKTPSIDPLKDANAAAVRLDNGITNLDEESLDATGVTYQSKHHRTVEIANMRRSEGLFTPGNNALAPVSVGPTDNDPPPLGGEVKDPEDDPALDDDAPPPVPAHNPPPKNPGNVPPPSAPPAGAPKEGAPVKPAPVTKPAAPTKG